MQQQNNFRAYARSFLKVQIAQIQKALNAQRKLHNFKNHL